MTSRSLKHFVEQELGKLPHFLIYAVLECALILMLYMSRIVTYLSNLFASLFELEPPCLLCTWVNPLFDHTDHDLHYNTTMCEGHKKEISSLAYCHVHRTLSDLRTMCDACLLAFTSENNAIASLATGNNKDIDSLFNDELRARLKMPSMFKDDHLMLQGNSGGEKASADYCSCCGEPMKGKSSSYQKPGLASAPSWASQAPAPSPRTSFSPWKNEESRSVDLPPIKPVELKLPKSSLSISTSRDEESGNFSNQVKEDGKQTPSAASLLPESEDIADELRTPSFARGGNKFLNLASADSTAASPRFAMRTPRKSLSIDLNAADPFENVGLNEPEDSIVNRLKRQMRLDRKALVEITKELDEERSASAVAANNAMAMITRLQADKASVQMEALQYQRMMDEQAEYDQEALSSLHELLEKREYEMRDIQDELQLYRERHGALGDVVKRNYHFDRAQSFESFTEKSDHEDGGDGHASPDESVFDLETDVDHDPSIAYYDHAYAIYENEQLQAEEEEMRDYDGERSHTSDHLRGSEASFGNGERGEEDALHRLEDSAEIDPTEIDGGITFSVDSTEIDEQVGATDN